MAEKLPAPNAGEVPINFAIDAYATGWQTALERAPKVESSQVALDVDRPRAMAVRITSPTLKTFSFCFPEAPDWLFPRKDPKPPKADAPRDASGEASGADVSPSEASTVSQSPAPTEKRTRLKPPSDVVKLEDRLYYLLQPPLESLVAGAEIEFPFEPFPYQFEGIAFLYPRWSAVLADEMGLGKTMQAISTIRLLLAAGELRSVLLVCPKPLVSNWRREFNLWAPEIPITIIEGDSARRHWQWSQRNTPVKIANYEALMRDRELVVDGALHFDLMVLDEAQRIKNRNGATNELVKSVSRTRNWALTGTPVENRPDDLVGIFEFLSPGFLTPSMPLRDMARAAGEHILRRTKDKVLTDMPPKMYRDAHVELSPEQFATYKIAEDEGVIRLNEMGDELTVQHVFELVLRLKQICNFDPLTGASSKLDQLEADIEEVAASGKKAIVFSQWVRTLKAIKERVARFNPLEYHGQLPHNQREQVIGRFKSDPRSHVILMSYGAGSVGLNLQFCEYVFLFDRWWNPAVEDQAINRAHRIGAAGAVTVTRMMALGTIEERIHAVLEEKRAMFEAVFSEAGLPPGSGLCQEEIFGLFNLCTPKGPIRLAA